MKKRKQPPRRRRWPAVLLVITAVIATVAGALYVRPLPSLTGQVATGAGATGLTASGTASVSWPAYGQSAVGAVGYGPIASSGPQTPLPTASVAKVMTALAVLDKQPLVLDASGPMLTIDDNDIDIYNWYFAHDGVVAAVQPGEQISQFDVLQAALMRSANNMADKLAIATFGSLDAYYTYANDYAKRHGMTHTTITSASGYDPKTVMTADDMIRMGSLAMQNPVIAKIVGTRQATIPVAGTIGNVNGLIGRKGVNGIKPGSIDEAGGVFLASAKRTLADGTDVTVLAAVMGGSMLDRTMLDSLPLLDAATANLHSQTVARKGQSFGSYLLPWSGQTVTAVAEQDLSILTWPGNTVTGKVDLTPLQGAPVNGKPSGSVSATSYGASAHIPLILQGEASVPATRWRIYDRIATDLQQKLRSIVHLP